MFRTRTNAPQELPIEEVVKRARVGAQQLVLHQVIRESAEVYALRLLQQLTVSADRLADALVDQLVLVESGRTRLHTAP